MVRMSHYHQYGYPDTDRPTCSYQTFHSTSTDSSCSAGQLTSHLPSPIVSNPTALANSLNPLQNTRFPNYQARYDFTSPATGTGQMTGGMGRSQKPGRRPRDSEEDPEEMEKKLKRRLRNKEAAARCRQRRLDLMGNLQDQVDQLKQDSAHKMDQIQSLQQKINKMVDVFKTHKHDLPHEVQMKVQNILNQSYPSSNCQLSNSNVNCSAPNDYQPAHGRGLDSHGIRPLSHGPSESDMNLLEPETKIPKLELDPTLPIISTEDDNPRGSISRPNQLGLEPVTTTGSLGITTPSNFASQPPTFTGMYQSGENFSFLNQPTGLTPLAAPPVGIVPQTPTPLQNSNSDLQPL